MSGHSKFKKIKHKKGAQDAKRSNIFTKLIREIIVATKTGGNDPEFNARLRTAISDARNENMPKDRIDNAIKKASANDPDTHYDEVRYEGYGPSGTAIIVEGLTDNRNRTASELRTIFGKNGGHLAETGSVSYMFDRIGYILYDKNKKNFINVVLEYDIQDCIEHDDCYEVICTQENFHIVKDKLEAVFKQPIDAKLEWRAQNIINLNDESYTRFLKLLNALHDNDDIQSISHNVNEIDMTDE